MPRPSTGHIEVENHLSLFYRRWPGQVGKPVLVFVHGMGEHSGRYHNPIDYFHRKGFTIYAYDQRGHGQSGGPRMYAERFARLLGDLDTVLDFIRKKEGSKQVFLVGHSFGGQVVLNYAARNDRREGHGIAGIMVSSPNIRLAMPVPWIKKHLGLMVASLCPTLRIPSGLQSKDLSRDPAVVQAYDRDPLVQHTISVRLASEMLENQERLSELAKQVTQPVLLMHAGADQICSADATRAFYAACGAPDKTLKIYPENYHELFNEYDKLKVFAEMENWVTQHNRA